MKILAISKVVEEGKQQPSAIDLWRIYRPMKELQKHVDWQIDFQPHVLKDFDNLEKKYIEDPDLYIKEKGEEMAAHLGQYDIVFTSYFTSPHVYTVLWGAARKYGTKFILDMDDNLYQVDPENPFWLAAGEVGQHFLSVMGEVAPYISTTTEELAKTLKDRSQVNAEIFINPNYISEQYKEYSPDNKEKVVIGYFGGASHYHDLHDTGVLTAIERIMHENKSVHFHSCGIPIDTYLPKKRYKEIDVAEGTDWPTVLWRSLGYDISLGPLRDTPFNENKSNIKWQESTQMGAAFVASNIGPYKNLSNDVVKKVPNDPDAWYIALKELVENEQKRKELVSAAKVEIKKNYTLEKHWDKYKEMFEKVKA